MHHKRKKPKSNRSGCVCCKPYKDNAFKDAWEWQTRQEQFSRISEEEQLEEFYDLSENLTRD